MPKIVFGTDGWRARIAEEYTYDAVRVCANGVAEWVKSTGEGQRGIVIGFDRRFSPGVFADAPAAVGAAPGTPVPPAATTAPPPSFSSAPMRTKGKAGMRITASH